MINKLIVLFFFLMLPQTILARPIIADLALHSINIDTNFRGIDILLFGAREDAGDIIVAVRGPEHDYVVRKKERVFGVWVNKTEQKLKNINSFYSIASSKDLLKIDNEYLLTALGLGLDDWSWLPEKSQRFVSNSEFARALYNAQQNNGLFAKELKKVSFWGETLFRTNIWFPANIEGGVYNVEVYLFSGGQVTAVQSTPIYVTKVGFEAFVYGFAHQHAVLYGIAAVLLAFFIGWSSSLIFRKV